ncbi:hypothetical protein EDB19DRAFT_237501 [Suillus lakei]|nr:hypothetical protein EDB19DRAFT_237501 [Suillus lakei]
MSVVLVYAVIAMILASFLHAAAAAGGNTTCAGDLTQWYTNAVGETACETYQRLRQICNANYQVPSFRANTPGDNCDDQVADCCCNSISWALSMLCMNCQWDVNSGSTNGIDAGTGAYGMYLASCSAPVNQSLPAEVQTAVCNNGIKIANSLYGLFWVDGSWYYVYTEETAQKDEAASNNNMYNSHCPNIATSTSLSPSTSATITLASQTPAGTTVTTSDAGPIVSSTNPSIQSPSTILSKGTATTTSASQMLNGTNAAITGTGTNAAITGTGAVPPASTNDASSVTNSSHTSSLKVIIGAVLGGLVGLCSLLAIFWWRRRKSRSSKGNDSAMRQHTTTTSPYPITNADVAHIDPSFYGNSFAHKQARAAAVNRPSPVDHGPSLAASATPSQSIISNVQGS